MIGRTLWFAVGAGAGVYTTVKARRLAYRLTPEGVSDQVAVLGIGARAFADEVRVGMAEREEQVAAQLGLPAAGRARMPALEERAIQGPRAPADSTPSRPR